MAKKQGLLLQPITVTTLNNQIKSLLETHYLNVFVEGEVSRVTYHASGHLYFTLKDKNSAISCVMFKGNNQKMKFRLEEGMAVIISGGISVYTPRGSYQINCHTLEVAGSGALSIAYEQLKKRLEQKGYFAQERKKVLPKFPKHIVIVTSKTGAAIQDMYNVAKKRWPLCKFTLIDTTVQGENAAFMIKENIQKADKLNADIIIVGRGGGSMEDLWAFNEEIVADAIYNANTPVVSAVGHEIDFLISDFVADLRAPTPSAAMELVLPDQMEMRIYLDSLRENYDQSMQTILHKKETKLKHISQLFEQNSFKAKLEIYEEEIKNLKDQFKNFFALNLQNKQNSINALKNAFENNNPAKRDTKGIAQVSKDGKKIDLTTLKQRDIFQLQTSKVSITAQVQNIQNLS